MFWAAIVNIYLFILLFAFVYLFAIFYLFICYSTLELLLCGWLSLNLFTCLHLDINFDRFQIRMYICVCIHVCRCVWYIIIVERHSNSELLEPIRLTETLTSGRQNGWPQFFFTDQALPQQGCRFTFTTPTLIPNPTATSTDSAL